MHRLTVASHAVMPVSSDAVSGCPAPVCCGILCGQKCGILCGTGFRTQGRPRPRQHWLFACILSPTTRPLHRKRLGEVRVVGLRTACSQVQAGAGPAREGSVSGSLQINDEFMDGDKKKIAGRRVRQDGLWLGDETGGDGEVCGLGEVRSWVGG
jgi:hypothetical protein